MNVTVVGSGYVGTVVAACFAKIGHRVVAYEVSPAQLGVLQSGKVPFYEPGLESIVQSGLADGNLRFTDSPTVAVAETDLVFFCVGTPPGEDSRPDMTAMNAAARSIAAALHRSTIAVVKSTVPIGSGNWLRSIMSDVAAANGSGPIDISVASNPEFLREGSAVADFLYPDRIVVGSEDPVALDLLTVVYQPIVEQTFAGANPRIAPDFVATDLTTAETIKYAANAFLASKISFINEIASICDAVGAEVLDVATAIGLDSRIGRSFLKAGIGWGGSCFGKDIDALRTTAQDLGIASEILDAVRSVNDRQRRLPVDHLERELGNLAGKVVAILGLAFKPDTDDMRDAPSLDIIRRLHAAGAEVKAYDPAVKNIADVALDSEPDPYSAAERADAIVIVTDWDEFASLDLVALRSRMSGDLLIDGRNQINPEAAASAGLRYVGIGRGRRIPIQVR